VHGQGQFLAELGPKNQAPVLDFDGRGGNRSLKLLMGTDGDGFRWRGSVAMRAVLSTLPQTLQFRAQTGDR
jgi:hypothetical protein